MSGVFVGSVQGANERRTAPMVSLRVFSEAMLIPARRHRLH
jgi:hypothetical protein